MNYKFPKELFEEIIFNNAYALVNPQRPGGIVTNLPLGLLKESIDKLITDYNLSNDPKAKEHDELVKKLSDNQNILALKLPDKKHNNCPKCGLIDELNEIGAYYLNNFHELCYNTIKKEKNQELIELLIPLLTGISKPIIEGYLRDNNNQFNDKIIPLLIKNFSLTGLIYNDKEFKPVYAKIIGYYQKINNDVNRINQANYNRIMRGVNEKVYDLEVEEVFKEHPFEADSPEMPDRVLSLKELYSIAKKRAIDDIFVQKGTAKINELLSVTKILEGFYLDNAFLAFSGKKVNLTDFINEQLEILMLCAGEEDNQKKQRSLLGNYRTIKYQLQFIGDMIKIKDPRVIQNMIGEKVIDYYDNLINDKNNSIKTEKEEQKELDNFTIKIKTIRPKKKLINLAGLLR